MQDIDTVRELMTLHEDPISPKESYCQCVSISPCVQLSRQGVQATVWVGPFSSLSLI